jgi:hypothetical protein
LAPSERRASPDFLVKVVSLKWRSDDLTPEQRFDNRRGGAREPGHPDPNEEHGLLKYWLHQGPDVDEFVYYRHRNGGDPQVELSCITTDVFPNPLCLGHVLFIEVAMSLHVQFPRDALPVWRETVLAVRDLVEGWRGRS